MTTSPCLGLGWLNQGPNILLVILWAAEPEPQKFLGMLIEERMSMLQAWAWAVPDMGPVGVISDIAALSYHI